MAKRPGGVQRLRCWHLMRDLGTFTMAQLVGDEVSRPVAKWLVGRLSRAGVIERVDGAVFDPSNPGTYRLKTDLGRRCPSFRRDGTLSIAPTRRERLWMAMKPLRHGWTVAELAGLARCRASTAADYVTVLARAGVLCIAGKDGGRLRYRLTPGADTGPEPPMTLSDGRVYDPNSDTFLCPADTAPQGERLWAAMRRLPDWTLSELREFVGVPAGLSNIRHFVRDLEAAGLVERLTPGRFHVRYRLAPGADTGPLAPRIGISGTVTDRNTGRAHRPAAGGGEGAA